MRAILDGELVALDANGKPDFALICECLLQRRCSALLTYMVFDVLSVAGESVAAQPYSERRRILEDMQLSGHSGERRRLSTTATPYWKRCANTN